MKAAALAMLLQATAYVPANNVGAIGEPLHAGISCAVPRSHKHLLRTWIKVDGRHWYVNDICGPKDPEHRFSDGQQRSRDCLRQAQSGGYEMNSCPFRVEYQTEDQTNTYPDFPPDYVHSEFGRELVDLVNVLRSIGASEHAVGVAVTSYAAAPR